MSKHTPGKWFASEATFDKKTWMAFNDSKGLNIVKKPNPEYGGLGGGDVIAVVWSSDGEDATEIANARLIAAAPDMLEALERIKKYAPEVFCLYGLREAYSKATGEGGG